MTLHFVCCVAILWTVAVTTAGAMGFADVRAEEIEALLQEHFSSGDAGMVIGLIDDEGSRVFSAGKLGNGTNRQVDGDTLFEICSVTKVFTATLLLDAVRRGEAQRDDPASEYLPESVTMPTRDGTAISLIHLAAQESGLPFNPEDPPGSRGADFDSWSAEELYNFLSDYKLTVVPGTGFRYSNTGFALLGRVLERRTGLDYERLVTDRICGPLGMDSTCITLTPELRERLSTGHDAAGRTARHLQLNVMASAGALLSTVNDMLKFLSAALSLEQSSLTPLIEETLVVRHRNQPRYGTTAMPWFDEGVYIPPDSEILAHGGGSPGYRSFLGVDKKKRRGVVVLSNQTQFNPMGVGWRLLQGFPLTGANVTDGVREIVGVGVALGRDEETGLIRVTSVFPKSPAGKAGLSGNLEIAKINNIAVRGKRIDECLAIMAGPVGTKVHLELVHPESLRARTVELTKERFLTLTE